MIFFFLKITLKDAIRCVSTKLISVIFKSTVLSFDIVQSRDFTDTIVKTLTNFYYLLYH